MSTESGEAARYRRLRRIGAGGMGVVFESIDVLRGGRVALKTLHPGKSTRQVLSLKNEFRLLSNISHPNLINMRELHVEGDEVFFTMDFVEGVDIVSYVWGTKIPQDDCAISSERLVLDNHTTELHGAPFEAGAAEDAFGVEAEPTPLMPPWDGEMEARLRHVLKQLVEGVVAIHSYGLLHRDLKPSNILVTERGGLIILDFGIAQDATPRAGEDRWVLGTPVYAAPEQITRSGSVRASDWYAIGAILHHVLFGFEPYCGVGSSSSSLLIRKQTQDVVLPPSAADRPSDLCTLAQQLLARDPALRPQPAQIVTWVHARTSRFLSTPPPANEGQFVNRLSERKVLGQALKRSQTEPTVVEIVANPGLGKSALVNLFAREAIERHSAVVFQSLCHERESVPYKAFDGIIDDLRAYLEKQNMSDLSGLLPLDWDLLISVFPALGFGEYAVKPSDFGADPHETRLLAFRALRDTLKNIADTRPLVLLIDDAQWADEDSAAILSELFREPFGHLLLVLRRPLSQPTEFLRQLDLLVQEVVERKVLELSPLGTEDCLALAQALFPGQPKAEQTRWIATESSGSPFLVCQMTQYLSDLLSQGGTLPDSLSVDSVVQSRLMFLAKDMRHLLDVLSLAGRPLYLRTLARIVDSQSLELDLHHLRQLQLVQLIPAPTVDGEQRIFVYHDRIREAVVRELDPSHEDVLHLQLARALEATLDEDFEAIAAHYRHAGELASARNCLLQAAVKAERALAFERAAEIYEKAIALSDEPDDDLMLQWARALVRAGHGKRAAEPFLAVASRSDHATSLELKRLAAEHLMITGHFAEATEVLRDVLLAVGTPMPKTSWQAWVGAMGLRVRLLRRKLVWKGMPSTPPTQAALLKIDTYRAVSWTLSLVDTARSVYFDALCALEALDAGEPERLVKAFCSHANFVASAGGSARIQAEKLIEFADTVAADWNRREEHVSQQLNRRFQHALFGEFEECLEGHAELLAEYGSLASKENWTFNFAQSIHARALAEVGAWKRHAELLDRLIPAANQRQDLYFACSLSVFFGYYRWLRIDLPQRARSELVASVRMWPLTTWNLQTVAAKIGLAQIHLYLAEPEAALQTITATQKEVQRSSLRFVELSNLALLYALGCSAIAFARTRDTKAAAKVPLSTAKSCAKKLHKIGTPYARCSARILDAGVSIVEHDRERAEAHLNEALELAKSTGRKMHESAISYQLATLQAGEKGELARGDALAFMVAEGVLQPLKVVRMLCPGFDPTGDLA